MSDAYRKVKAGRLAFKGGELAVVKSINKKKHKMKKPKEAEDAMDAVNGEGGSGAGEAEDAAGAVGAEAYTIDAAKKMKYEELFPVESMKFGYDPANKSRNGTRTVEEALDDRVRRKADRYCK
ncbi:uncharacterized protein LOC110023688 [Phalaenopsis equestris]|uniref:uncharacterized protein LOC110023688 n=1 Tax=Phalaenopsis equestris TaxID=78828 RepID=UPI0009E36CA3|nr:uncharacterized protein LOC110023688 [Phalaenopsis equestris]